MSRNKMAFKSKWFDRWMARSFHILLTTGVVLILFLKDTDLRKSMEEKQLIYPASFLTLVAFSMVSYLVTSLMDPGYVTQKSNVNVEDGLLMENKEPEDPLMELTNNHDESEHNQNESSRMILPEGNALKLRRCGYCEILQPLRAKHCEECGYCIRRYDHHCPWLATCVGEKNHRFFWVFLGIESALIGWAISIVWKSFKHENSAKEWFSINWLFLLLIAFLGLSLLAVVLLFSCHSYMMLTAQTTWEFMSRPRISYLKHFPEDENPFHQGYFKNTLVFLCYCKPRTWEKLISKKLAWK